MMVYDCFTFAVLLYFTWLLIMIGALRPEESWAYEKSVCFRGFVCFTSLKAPWIFKAPEWDGKIMKNPIIAQACQTDLGPYSISTRVRESSLTKHHAKIQLNSEKNLVVYRGLCYPVMYGKRVLYGFVLWLLCLWVIEDHYTYQWIMYDRVGWFEVFLVMGLIIYRFHLDEWWAYIGLHWLIV